LKIAEATLGGAASLRIRPVRRALYSLLLKIFMMRLRKAGLSWAKDKKNWDAGNKPSVP
jgi:hypothetical protein